MTTTTRTLTAITADMATTGAIVIEDDGHRSEIFEIATNAAGHIVLTVNTPGDTSDFGWELIYDPSALITIEH